MILKNAVVLILTIINLHLFYSQNKDMYDENIFINCEKEKLNWIKIDMDSIKYQYALISKNYYANDRDINYYIGLIILPIEKKKTNRDIIEELLKYISIKENLFEITAIENCETQKLYYSSYLNDEQKIELRKNIIGRFRLGLKK